MARRNPYLKPRYWLDGFDSLSPAEMRVALMLCRYEGNQIEAAAALGRQLSTVKSHVNHIYEKTDTHSMANMLLRFIRWRLQKKVSRDDVNPLDSEDGLLRPPA